MTNIIIDVKRKSKMLAIKSIFGFLASTTLLLTACAEKFITDVDIDVADVTTELIVEAYVGAGDTAVVYLSETTPIQSSNSFVEVPSATVRLFVDGEEIAELLPERRFLNNFNGFFDPGRSADSITIYRSSGAIGPLAEGATVRVTVKTAEGVDASASAIVPGAVQLRNLSASAGPFDTKRLTIELNDEAGEDAYLVTGIVRLPDERIRFDTATGEVTRDTVYGDERLQFETGDELDYFYWGRRYVTDDVAFDGGNGILNLGTYYFNSFSDGSPDTVIIRVAPINPLAAEYIESFVVADFNDGNPFIEPVIIPDGVEGGRGMLILSGIPEERVLLVEE